MAGTLTEDYGALTEDYEAESRFLSVVGMSSELRCQSVDSLAEWRSSEQVENGTPSTSPPYWDTDDDDDCGPKPSELYGKFTWKIESFSTVNKRELRSNAFEVGGYKWYILIYPQGCDVCNHLSLFLCVANHEKLLPGWSHFAQFTIAVVNKDPKKSKYSDTLHRFWKKEHDWGWKKFMELSKVHDGFIVNDTLVIKAQVQVIREKAHRPFRCLDIQYRRELVRVYLSNVEQICRRFIEDRRSKLSKLIEDKIRWSSFRAFWLGIDQNARRRMSRDKNEAILKVVVKHFFIEKEVTSTLVMDSLYSGLKALEFQNKNTKGRAKLELEECPASMVRVEKDLFVLADDVLLLLERAALEPLPHQSLPPKDDKGSQNRIKDGSSGEEFNKDSIERDERRLTELGRRTVEIFVLSHIFSSRIEVAYQEAVALKRQEELIREEEAAGHAENDIKAKRGAAEKEKRAKKKQAKQKRSSRKGKDRGKDEKSDVLIQDRHQEENPSSESNLEDISKQPESVLEKLDILEDVSDVSDIGDDAAESLQPDLEDRDASAISWDTDTSEIHPAMEASNCEIQNVQIEKKNPSVMDDSSSTCSTDSVPSVVMNGPYKGNSLSSKKGQTSPNRGKSDRSKDTRHPVGSANSVNISQSDAPAESSISLDAVGSRKQPESDVLSLKDRIQWLEQHLVEKEEEVVTLQKKLSSNKDQIIVEIPQKKSSSRDHLSVQKSSESETPESSTSGFSSGKNQPQVAQQPMQASGDANTIMATEVQVPAKEPSLVSPSQAPKPVMVTRSQVSPITKAESQKLTTPPKSIAAAHLSNAVSRPSSAPLIPGPKPNSTVVSTSQTAPLLSRSVSAAGRLGTDPPSSVPSYVPQSYRNAIIGKSTMGASPASYSIHPASTSLSQAAAYSLSSTPVLPPQAIVKKDQSSSRSGFSFGSVKPEAVHSQNQWREDSSQQLTSSSTSNTSSSRSQFTSDIERLDIFGGLRAKLYANKVSSTASSRQAQSGVVDEFPHLDIINDLLDEEQSISKVANGHHHRSQSFNRQYSFPGDMAMADAGSSNFSARFDHSDPYYDGIQIMQSAYHSSGGPLGGLGDSHHRHLDLSAYANEQIEGLSQNHWPYAHGHADLSMLNLGSVDSNAYSYQIPEFLNVARGVNAYNMYRPSNGP